MEKALAYVLIVAKHGYSQAIAQELLEFEEVQNIHELFGQYDLIIKVLLDDTKQLSAFIHEQIISMPEVERTETLVVSDVPKED